MPLTPHSISLFTGRLQRKTKELKLMQMFPKTAVVKTDGLFLVLYDMVKSISCHSTKNEFPF